MGILPDYMIRRDCKITPLSEPFSEPGKISHGLSSYGYDVRCGYKFKIFTPSNCAIIDPKNFSPESFISKDVTPQTHESHQWREDIALDGWTCLRCKQWILEKELSKTKCSPPVPDHVLIPPNSFALAETLEHFDIPRDCLAIVLGKSTYARCGIVMNFTPLEPEWRGTITIEVSNTTNLPAKIYAGEGIAQVLFFRTDGHSEAVLNAIRRLCGPQVQHTITNQDRLPKDHLSDDLKAIEQLLHTDLGNGTCKRSYADKKGLYQDQSGVVEPRVRS